MTRQSGLEPVPTSPALPSDAELPALALSLDARQVAAWFERTGRGRVLQCALQDTKYLPGVLCLSSYRLRLQTPRGPQTAFGAVQVTPAGLGLHWHDEDPGLPWLGAAGNGAIAAAALSACGSGDLDHVTATPVRYRPGVRAVVRYDADTPRGPVTFFGRVYAQDADRHAETHHALASLPDPHGALVSPLLGTVPELHLTLEFAAPGASASALVFGMSPARRRRLTISRSIGTALATLHCSPGTTGPPRALDDDLRDVCDRLPVVAHADPVLADHVSRLVDGVKQTAEDGPWVPSHGAMRTDQVLVSDSGGVTLLDLDGYCWADPSRDVGNMLAYLRWRAIRHVGQPTLIGEVRGAFLTSFLTAYRERAGDIDESAIARCEAASLLKIAVRRYANLRLTEWPLVPQLLDAAAQLTEERQRRQRRLPKVRAGLDGAPEILLTSAAPAPTAAPRSPVWSPLPLRQATDLAHVGDELVSAARAGRLGGRMRPVRASVVSVRSEQRALLRYDLVDDAGVSRIVFGKLFREPAHAARTHETLTALHEHAYASDHDLAVPEPLGLIASPPVVVYRPAHGPFLDALLHSDAAATSVAAAARWLAVLHGAPVTLERRLDLDKETDNIAGWAVLVAQRLPQHAAATARLAGKLLRQVDELGELPCVPIHKDFHHQHVIVNHRLTVIDVDEARMGPPQLDVAHFCAYLHLLGLRIGAPVTARRLGHLFVDEYRQCTGWGPDNAHRFFLGWACLKVARQLATGRGLYPRPVGAERDRQVDAMLAQGLAWLG